MAAVWERASSSRKVKTTRIRRAGSFSSFSHARPFWTTIYQGLKQAVPWKSRKLKKDGIVI
ncbi:uncharacterized protein Pyn_38225 [Prunus yedoensis var. nudiflora]|uniref:Uncharacterized protein n=1 Tax=Prunus yedoensis var. nudiflora TaxID=2094558 RepID=A0A314ZW25_PRUYE|nr:uncharacterized protein Pyn_38225 [Prunus yedoensis var. nudiflora]